MGSWKKGVLAIGCILFFPTLLMAANTKTASVKPVLKVYTYKSFVSKWGPGQKIKEAFERKFPVVLEWVPASDSVAMWGRIRMEGKMFSGDLIMGLDSHLMHEVLQSGLLEPANAADYGLKDLPPGVGFESGSGLVPYQYGYYALIYDERKMKPFASWDEFVQKAPEKSLIIQDPRTSTVGLGFLSWTKTVYGTKWDHFMSRLRPKLLTVTKGWSDAYGLFLKGEASAVMSYRLSEAYHLVEEKTSHYKGMIFKKGHPVQTEGIGIARTSQQKELSRKFIEFLLEPHQQQILATKSWMYPVRPAQVRLPEVFESLSKPRFLESYQFSEIGKQRKSWVDQWTKSMIAL